MTNPDFTHGDTAPFSDPGGHHPSDIPPTSLRETASNVEGGERMASGMLGSLLFAWGLHRKASPVPPAPVEFDANAP
jgi:hypothetical protein